MNLLHLRDLFSVCPYVSIYRMIKTSWCYTWCKTGGGEAWSKCVLIDQWARWCNLNAVVADFFIGREICKEKNCVDRKRPRRSFLSFSFSSYFPLDIFFIWLLMTSNTTSKNASDAKRWLIIGAHQAGASEKRVARISGLSKTAVRHIILNYQRTGDPCLPKREPKKGIVDKKALLKIATVFTGRWTSLLTLPSFLFNLIL
jgi:hypothetical protein